MMRFSYTWVILLSIFSVIAIFICIPYMGGGHGTYVPAILLFPWGMLGTVGEGVISPVFVIVGLMQYPVYGIIIGNRAQIKNFPRTITLMIVMHVVLAILIIMSHR